MGNFQIDYSGIIYSLNNYLLGISYVLDTFRIHLFWHIQNTLLQVLEL